MPERASGGGFEGYEKGSNGTKKILRADTNHGHNSGGIGGIVGGLSASGSSSSRSSSDSSQGKATDALHASYNVSATLTIHELHWLHFALPARL